MEEADEKRRSGERDQVSLQGPETLLKRTPGGSSSLHHVKRVMALRALGQILTCGFTQPKLVWFYKRDLETVLCYKRAGNKHTQVSSVVLVCVPDARAVLSSLSIATACFTEVAGPSLGRPGLLWEGQGSGEAGKAG